MTGGRVSHHSVECRKIYGRGPKRTKILGMGCTTLRLALRQGSPVGRFNGCLRNHIPPAWGSPPDSHHDILYAKHLGTRLSTLHYVYRLGRLMARYLVGTSPQAPRLEPYVRLSPRTAQHFPINLGLSSVTIGAEDLLIF